MMQKSTYTIEELFRKLPISISELARKAKISEVTAAGIRDGKVARLHTLNKLLNVLSEEYGVELSIDNVTGLHIMGGRYGEKTRSTNPTPKAEDQPKNDIAA